MFKPKEIVKWRWKMNVEDFKEATFISYTPDNKFMTVFYPNRDQRINLKLDDIEVKKDNFMYIVKDFNWTISPWAISGLA